MKILSRLLLSLALMCSGLHLAMAADQNKIYAVAGSQAGYSADIKSGHSSSGDEIVASVIEGHSRPPPADSACSPPMKARTILFDGPFLIGGYDQIFSQAPEQSVVVRRFGQVPSTEPSVKVQSMREPWNRDADEIAELDLGLKAVFLVCEFSGFVDILGGSLSVTGTVGQYHISVEHPIATDAKDIVSVQWERRFTNQKADAQLGELKVIISQNDLIAQALNSDKTTTANFRMSVEKEISLSRDDK